MGASTVSVERWPTKKGTAHYALKNNGKLFRRAFGQWSAIALKGSRQLAIAGKDLFTLEENEDVWHFDARTGNWTNWRTCWRSA